MDGRTGRGRTDGRTEGERAHAKKEAGHAGGDAVHSLQSRGIGTWGEIDAPIAYE